MLSSYPTYEEWKLQIWLLVNIYSICSYPTYEEWKLEREIYYIEVQAVLILPMRNGNDISVLKPSSGNPFLSYLWGMETD